MQKNIKNNNFDFIRITAASLVLFSHHYALTGKNEISFFGLYSLGGFAVIIFFIISGYLVMSSWERDPNALRFISRRILRIWPALTLVVILTAYGLGTWVTKLPTIEYLQHGATLDYLRSILMQIHFVLPGVFENNPYPRSVNGSLWTIPFEVRCYIVLVLAGLFGLAKNKYVLLLCIACFMIWFLITSNADATGVIHQGRQLSAFFLAGVAVQILEQHWRRRPDLWLIGIGIAFILIWSIGWRHTAMLISLPFLTIYAGLKATPVICQAGRWGDPSYGIYLLAFPIQQTVILYTWPHLGFFGTLLLALTLTVIMAYASWHFIEKQALKLKPIKSNKSNTGLANGGWTKSETYLSAVTKISEFTQNKILSFFVIFFTLSTLYLSWLIATWPGVLGQDSLAIMLEVDTNREFQANKPAFWFMYVRLFYGASGRVEIPIIIQLLICAVVCARILSWMLEKKMWKSFIYCLFFVALAPSVVYYSSSLYSDGIYAITLSGLLFEAWRCMKNKSIDRSSAIIIFITIPFAIFSRPNGILNLIPLIALVWMISKTQRIRFAAIILPWLIIGFGGQIFYKYNNPIGSIFPLALYETVGFLEHRPMGLWENNEPRVTKETIKAITSTGKTIEQISEFYDHYYWDPLIFFPKGPALLSLTPEAKKTIIKEFFKYNAWHNFPALAASRINIMLYSFFANGGIPGPLNAKNIINQTKSKSKPEAYNLPTDSFLIGLYATSIKYRSILWAPWLGFILIFFGLSRSIKSRENPAIIITGTYALQFIAVFIFSIAGEYRYLLAFFTAPLALLPILFNTYNKENV